MTKKIKQSEFNMLANVWFVKNLRIAGTVILFLIFWGLVGSLTLLVGYMLYREARIVFWAYTVLIGSAVSFTIIEVSNKLENGK